jgi:hypothetical protein
LVDSLHRPLAWKLLVPEFIGMADNGDFGKVAGAAFVSSVEHAHENFFHSVYTREEANCFQASVYFGTAPAGLASAAEWTVGDKKRFPFYYVVLMLLRPLGKLSRFALSRLALWIFADIGMVAYFNPFYSDTAALRVLGNGCHRGSSTRVQEDDTRMADRVRRGGTAGRYLESSAWYRGTDCRGIGLRDRVARH